ncbi:MAG: hypothetical protein NC319_05720 [Butyricicoccus sp.]|nr:hypothetical protein [Butyricicoccus sp.]
MSEFEDRINSILGDPEEMEKIINLASQFMGGADKKEEPGTERSGQNNNASGQSSDAGAGLGALGSLGGFDMEMFSKMSRLMSQVKGGSEKTELLRAMGPYLKQERREKLEKAVRFARIAKVAGAALREYGGGGDV